MSEHEFDVYLSVLSRLLRLEPGQREEIADELRDHLSERLDELLRAGCSREEAIRRALDEFGDAAGLAARFTHIVTSRRRRRLMRLTLGTLAVTAAAVFVGLALWPDAPGQPVAPNAVAQNADSQPENPLGSAQPDRAVRGRSGLGFGAAGGASYGYAARVPSPEEIALSKLKKPLEDVSFSEMPLSEVIEQISQSAEVDILVDRQLSEQGANLDEPVTLEIRHTKLPAATVLELALDQAGLGQVAGYTIRDGLVYITGKSQSNQIRVYNVRDVVFGTAPQRATGGGGYGEDMDMYGGGFPGAAGGYESATPAMGGGFGGPPAREAGRAARPVDGTPLTQVIRSTIRPQSWAETGGEAGLAEYNGLLIVKAGQDVHREIEQLLQMMRSAARDGSGGGDAATTIIPVPRR